MKEALLIGESNPYGSDPRYALYPEPANSAGDRLCRRILGLTVREYLRRFDRVNLCRGPWGIKEARATAAQLDRDRRPGFPVVLFGAKVCAAFGVFYQPFAAVAERKAGLIVLPHPSGLCRTWVLPTSIAQARAVLAEAGIDLVRKPEHTFTGNCFFGLHDETCKEHEEWRGECPKCAPCPACGSGEPG